MLFSVQHDPNDIEDITKTCIQNGQKLPDFIRDKPELMPGLEVFLQAFWDLSTCRQIGMGLGPIPWTAIQEYVTINGGSEQFNQELHFHIKRLDTAYLNWISESNKVATK